MNVKHCGASLSEPHRIEEVVKSASIADRWKECLELRLIHNVERLADGLLCLGADVPAWPRESLSLSLAVGLLCLGADEPAWPRESLSPFLAVGLLSLAADVPAWPRESLSPFLAVGLL